MVEQGNPQLGIHSVNALCPGGSTSALSPCQWPGKSRRWPEWVCSATAAGDREAAPGFRLAQPRPRQLSGEQTSG